MEKGLKIVTGAAPILARHIILAGWCLIHTEAVRFVGQELLDGWPEVQKLASPTSRGPGW